MHSLPIHPPNQFPGKNRPSNQSGGPPIHLKNNSVYYTQKVAKGILSSETKENKAQSNLIKSNPKQIWSRNPFLVHTVVAASPTQPSTQLSPSIPSVQQPIQSSYLNSNAPIPLFLDPNDPPAFYNPPIQTEPFYSINSNSPLLPISCNIPHVPLNNAHTRPKLESFEQVPSLPQFIYPQSPLLPQSPLPTAYNTPSSLSPLTVHSTSPTPSSLLEEPPSPPLLPMTKNQIKNEQDIKLLQPKPIVAKGHREKLTEDQIVIIKKVVLKRKSYILAEHPIQVVAFIEHLDKFFKNPTLKVSIHDKILMGSASTLPYDIRPFNDVDICYLIIKEPGINFLDFFNKLLNTISTFIQKKVLENNNLFLKLEKIINEILTNKIQIIDDEKGVYLAKYGLFGFDFTVVFYDTQLGQPCLIRDNVNTSGGFRISLIHNIIYCVDRNQICDKNGFELYLTHFHRGFFTVNEPEKVDKLAWRIVHAMRKGQEIDEILYPIALKQLVKKEFTKSDFEIHKMIVTNHIAHSNNYDIKIQENENKEKAENENNQKLSKEEKEKHFLESNKNKLKCFNDHEGELIEFLNFCLFIEKSENQSEKIFCWNKLARGLINKIPGSSKTLRDYHPSLFQIATLIKDKPEITSNLLHLIQGLLLFVSLNPESHIKCYVNCSKYQPEEIHSYFSYSFESKKGGNKTYYIYIGEAPLKLTLQYFAALKIFEAERIEIEKILLPLLEMLKLPLDFFHVENRIQIIHDLLQRKLPHSSPNSQPKTEKKPSKKQSNQPIERKEPFNRLNYIINQYPHDLSIIQFLNEINEIDPSLCKHPLFLPLFTSLKLKILNHCIDDKKNSQPLKQFINAVYHLYAKPNKNELINHLGVIHKAIKTIEDQSNIYKNQKHPLVYKEVNYAFIMGLSHLLVHNDADLMSMLINFSSKTYKKEYVECLLKAIVHNVKKLHDDSLRGMLQELFKLYINKIDNVSNFSKQESKLIFNILGVCFFPEIYDSCLYILECLYIINTNQFLKEAYSDEIVKLTLDAVEGITKQQQSQNLQNLNKALKFIIELEISRKLMFNIQKASRSEQVIKEYSEFKNLRFQRYLNIVQEIFSQFAQNNNFKLKGLDHKNFVTFLKILERLVPLSQWGKKNKIFIFDSIRTSQNNELIHWGISKIPFLSANLKLQIYMIRLYAIELVTNYRYQNLPFLKELCRQVNYSDPITILNLIKFLNVECKEEDFNLAIYALKKVYLTTWKDFSISNKYNFLSTIICYFNILSQKTKNKDVSLLCAKFILNSFLKGICKEFFKTDVPEFCDDLIILLLSTQNIEFIDLACWLLVKTADYSDFGNIGNQYLALFEFFTKIPIHEAQPLESFFFAIKKLCFHFPASKIQYIPQEALSGPDKINIFNLDNPSVVLNFCNMVIHLYTSVSEFNNHHNIRMLLTTADLLFNYYLDLDHHYYQKKLEHEFKNNKILITERSISHGLNEQPKLRISNFNTIFYYFVISQSPRYQNGEQFLQSLSLFINTQIHEDWQKFNCFLMLYDQIDKFKFDNIEILLEEFEKLLPYLCLNKILGWKLFYNVSHKLANHEYDLRKSYEWLCLIEKSTLLIDNDLNARSHHNYLSLKAHIPQIYLIFLDSLMANLNDKHFFNCSIHCLQKLYLEFDSHELINLDGIIERGLAFAYELIVSSFVHKNNEQFDQLILLLKKIYNRFEYSSEKKFRWLFNFLVEEFILIPLLFEECSDLKIDQTHDLGDSKGMNLPKEHKNHPIFGNESSIDIHNNKQWNSVEITEIPESLEYRQKPTFSKKFLNYLQINYLYSELGTNHIRSKITEKFNKIKKNLNFNTSINDKIFVNIVITILKKIPNLQDRKNLMDQEFKDSLFKKAITVVNTLLLTKPFHKSNPENECLYLLYLKEIFSHLTNKPEITEGLNKLLSLFIEKNEALKRHITFSPNERKQIKKQSDLLDKVLFNTNVSLNAPGTIMAQGPINCGVVNLSEIVNGVMESASKQNESNNEVIGVNEMKEAKVSRKSAKKNKRKKNRNLT